MISNEDRKMLVLLTISVGLAVLAIIMTLWGNLIW